VRRVDQRGARSGVQHVVLDHRTADLLGVVSQEADWTSPSL